MSTMHKLRAYHAGLALLALAAYVSGEWGLIHAWLGYGVGLMILIRLLLALSGAPQLGLSKYYPRFANLKLNRLMTHPAFSRYLLFGIAVCVIGATGTGMMMDKGQAIGLAEAQNITAAWADDEGAREREHKRDNDEDEALEEVHELFANLMLIVVALHVGYLLAYKRPLARFMLFLDKT